MSNPNFLGPIEEKVNTNGVLWDDDGYDQLPVEECGEPMVDLAKYSDGKGSPVKCYPVYEGFNPYTGERDINSSRAGSPGLGGVYMRQSNAEGVIAADRALRKMGMNLVITDGWRSKDCQIAGFVQYFTERYNGPGFDIRKFIKAGIESARICSPVKIDVRSPQFIEFRNDILSTHGVEFASLSTELGISVDDLASRYATFAINVEEARRIFPSAPKTDVNTRVIDALSRVQTGLNVALPLDYDNSTHPSGGSQDMLVENKGVIATPSGFDYVGKLGEMDPLEHMDFAEMQRLYMDDPNLRIHCKAQFNIDPEQLTDKHFNMMKATLRALHNTTDRSGATHYRGEFQHKQWGNIVRDPETGAVIYKGRAADKYPNAGNSCHSIQTMVRSGAVAIYGGLFAEREVYDKFGKGGLTEV